MVSLLGDYYYNFPQGFKLQYCLNDFLEKEVDEKYYLTGKTFEKIKAAIKKIPNDLESQMGICPTLTTRPDTLGYYEDFKIRKLTPTECWRLMGFKDSETNKVIECGMSNAQMYKQAGNGIVVNVLMAIFGSLLNIEWKLKINEKDGMYKK